MEHPKDVPRVSATPESMIGLYKTEVMRHEGPWMGLD